MFFNLWSPVLFFQPVTLFLRLLVTVSTAHCAASHLFFVFFSWAHSSSTPRCPWSIEKMFHLWFLAGPIFAFAVLCLRFEFINNHSVCTFCVQKSALKYEAFSSLKAKICTDLCLGCIFSDLSWIKLVLIWGWQPIKQKLYPTIFQVHVLGLPKRSQIFPYELQSNAVWHEAEQKQICSYRRNKLWVLRRKD